MRGKTIWQEESGLLGRGGKNWLKLLIATVSSLKNIFKALLHKLQLMLTYIFRPDGFKNPKQARIKKIFQIDFSSLRSKIAFGHFFHIGRYIKTFSETKASQPFPCCAWKQKKNLINDFFASSASHWSFSNCNQWLCKKIITSLLFGWWWYSG